MKSLLFILVFLIGLGTQAQNLGEVISREKKSGRDLLYIPDNGYLYKASSIQVYYVEGTYVANLDNSFLIGSIPVVDDNSNERNVCEFLNWILSLSFRGSDQGGVPLRCYPGTINNVGSNGSGGTLVECLPSSSVCFLVI